MRLGAPAALWLLALLPVIILLYMLRARREPMPVSSIMLWQRTRHDLAAQLPIRRLERNVLLLIQLLAVAAAVLALARPHVRLPAGSGQATVVVFDLSASMQATDVSPSRFDAARAWALEVLRGTGGLVMVIAAEARPRIVADWGDRAAAMAVLSRLRPSDGSAAIDQAIGLALAQRPGGVRPIVVVFTDGAGRQNSTPGPDGVQFFIVGSEARNLSLTRLHAQQAPGGTHVVLHIRNGGGQSERVPLDISLDGRRILARQISVPAGQTVSATAMVRGAGTIKAEITPRDFLAVDDAAYGIAGRPRPRVLVVGERDRALDEALTAIGAARIRAPRITPDTLSRADVVVLNGTPPVAIAPGNYLLIGTVAPNLPVAADGTMQNPVIVSWSGRHPVLRYVDLDSVRFAEALLLRPSGGEVLAEAEAPLIWAFSGGGIRAVVLGFSLAHTDLALHPAFPILLSNAVEWLAGPVPALEAGQPLVLPAGAEREAQLTDPSGATRTVVSRGGVFTVPSLGRAGIYSLVVGARRLHIAVNVPAEESQIAPGILPPSATPDPVRAAADREIPVWPVLAGAALTLLLLEWLLWLRTLPRRARLVSGHVLRSTPG